MWLFMILIALVTYLVYTKLMENLGYWKKRKIASCSKALPILGNVAPFVFGRKSTLELFKDLYDEFPDKRYNGMYICSTPTLLIRDPDLIKQITIKDFDNFADRSLFKIPAIVEPIFSLNILSLCGQKWRKLKSTISPFFTSSKIKLMSTLMLEIAETYTEHFVKQGTDVIHLEMRDICNRFTFDAIARTAFGVKVDSINDKNNDLYIMSKNMTNSSGLNAVKGVIYAEFPWLVKIFKIPMFSSRYITYIGDMLKESMEARKTENIRPDIIQLFVKAKKENINTHSVSTGEQPSVGEGGYEDVLTVESMTAQAIVFFIAGFDNTSTTMGFMTHELAINSEIQQKLQREIDDAFKECDGKITYEIISELKYLEMVTSETLRRWPTGPVFDRLCLKDYVISPTLPDEEEIIIEKGVQVFFPFGALHHDAKYFPNPMKFDPERFSEKNKANIVPCSYMPFGYGPRNCIGGRYAVMLMKVYFFNLLLNFDIVPTEKTSNPITVSKLELHLGSAKGHLMGLRRRRFIN